MKTNLKIHFETWNIQTETIFATNFLNIFPLLLTQSVWVQRKSIFKEINKKWNIFHDEKNEEQIGSCLVVKKDAKLG